MDHRDAPALRYSTTDSGVLTTAKFRGVSHYLRHPHSAAGAPLVLNATDLPVPLIKVTNGGCRSWNRRRRSPICKRASPA